MPVSRVSAILRRLALGKLAALVPKPTVIRYERRRPGELIHLERKDRAIDFLERALGWFVGQGVTVERVMTDKGSALLSRAFRATLAAAGLKQKRTRP